MTHSYAVGQVCVFTNCGVSGVTKYDGKRCEITKLKPPGQWFQGEPEYVIKFLNEDHGFGVRECELQPVS